MTNPMWITIEEMVKSFRGFTETNFETFSILSLVNQDVTGSTNLTMSSDEKEYIEVFFRENISVAFKKKFMDHAKKYNIFIQWYKCPSKRCKKHYLPSQMEDLYDHYAHHIDDNDHPFVWVDTQTGAFSKEVEEIFWMKKGKYYDLSPIIRQFVFDTEVVEEEEEEMEEEEEEEEEMEEEMEEEEGEVLPRLSTSKNS